MTEWYREHRESLVYRMPWHLPDPTPSRAAMLGLDLAICGTTIAIENRGRDYSEDPPLEDRCAVCQGTFIRESTRGS